VPTSGSFTYASPDQYGAASYGYGQPAYGQASGYASGYGSAYGSGYPGQSNFQSVGSFTSTPQFQFYPETGVSSGGGGSGGGYGGGGYGMDAAAPGPAAGGASAPAAEAGGVGNATPTMPAKKSVPPGVSGKKPVTTKKKKKSCCC